jgi:hypothetical protein
VLVVQMLCRLVHDEELGPVRVGPRVGHTAPHTKQGGSGRRSSMSRNGLMVPYSAWNADSNLTRAVAED